MDKYNQTFNVFTDQDDGGNHYIPSGWMGDWGDITYNANFCGDDKVTPYQGRSCIKINYSAQGAQGANWAGIYWQYPENNWGNKEGSYDLAGDTKLSFSARGYTGGEKVEFKLGGINTAPNHDPNSPYQDSCLSLSTGVITLTDAWKQYSIDLVSQELFSVYTDKAAGGNNRFVPCGWMGDTQDISFDDTYQNQPHSGTSCIKITYTPEGLKGWAGIYWLSKDCNWGDACGYDLTGATKLTFWAKGENGGEQAEFKIGGITGKCPDSIQPAKSTNVITLTNSWKQYTLSLLGENVRNVIGGFCWVANKDGNPNGCTIYIDDIQFDKTVDKVLSKIIGGFCCVASKTDNPQGCTFFIDDIKYDQPRPNDLRFLESYEVTCAQDDDSSRNASHIYDNALVMLAFMARGTSEDWARAKILADSFVSAQAHDRAFSDGRLRNAYQAGDLLDPTTGLARLPGWWDYDAKQWFEDKYQVSSYTGNLAWVMIALLRYYEVKGGADYLKAAEALGMWIYNNCYDENPPFGYTGGQLGWEANPQNPNGQEKIQWKSTEHNLDVYVAFTKLSELTKNLAWKIRAWQAKKFLRAMWNSKECHFWTGTLDDGRTINQTVVPEDVQTWGLMALGQVRKYGCSINWVENYCYVDPCPVCKDWKGFDFSYDFSNKENNREGVWWEGTAHMCVALQIKNENEKSSEFINELRRVQVSAHNNNSKGIVAACHDKVPTGFTSACESPEYPNGQCPFYYYNRLHIGATAWYIFAERQYNPFWQTPTSISIWHVFK